MKFPWRFVMVIVALVAGSLLLPACGGGEEELDLDEYFQQLEEIVESTNTRIETLGEESQGVGEDMEATRDYFEGVEAIVGQNLSDLKDISPPAEAQDAHDELVAALEERSALWQDFTEQVADLESISEVETLIEELDQSFEAIAERASAACLQVQGIADENGIEVDLECE